MFFSYRELLAARLCSKRGRVVLHVVVMVVEMRARQKKRVWRHLKIVDSKSKRDQKFPKRMCCGRRPWHRGWVIVYGLVGILLVSGTITLVTKSHAVRLPWEFALWVAAICCVLLFYLGFIPHVRGTVISFLISKKLELDKQQSFLKIGTSSCPPPANSPRHPFSLPYPGSSGSRSSLLTSLDGPWARGSLERAARSFARCCGEAERTPHLAAH